MSASRRRRPKKQQPEIEPVLDELEPVVEGEQLDELEPVDELAELDELEPVEEEAEDEGPVRVRCVDADEEGFDTAVVVEVPEMEKAAVTDAVREPLARAMKRHASRVRYKSVVIRFEGEALIGTAVKNLCADLLVVNRVLHGVVRRGYGDEAVAEGKLPEVAFEQREVDGQVQIEIRGGLEPEDLGVALQPVLAQLAGAAKGMRLSFQFQDALPSRAVREQIGAAMSDAGAESVAVGDRQLFDRGHERRVRVQQGSEGVEIEVSDAHEVDATKAAVEAVLGGAAFDGQDVKVRVGGAEPDAGIVDLLAERIAAGKPARLLVITAGGEDLHLPAVMQVAAKGGRSAMRIHLNGRSRGALLTAMRRELRAVSDDLAGTSLTIDWPAGFEIDSDLERAVFDELLLPTGVQAIACSFGSEDKEPFHPVAVAVGSRNGGVDVVVDTTAGKPPELLRAVERRLAPRAGELENVDVRVELRGDGVVSRSLRQRLIEIVSGALPARLELVEHEQGDVLMPAMLAISTVDGGFRIAADVGGRSEAQVVLAMARELDAAGVGEGAEISVVEGEFAQTVVEAVVARAAARVMLGDVQVHPEPEVIEELPEPEPEAEELDELEAVEEDAGVGSDVEASASAEQSSGDSDSGAAGAEAADAVSQPAAPLDYVTVLGSNESLSPPLVVVGIDYGNTEEHEAEVARRLAEMQSRLEGGRVLVVLRHGGRDVPLRRNLPPMDAARRLIEPIAAATMVFRGGDAAGRPFFQVTASKLDGLAVGAHIADPRSA
jgi:hypothetical protein